MFDLFAHFKPYSKHYSAELANLMEYRSQFYRLLNAVLELYEWDGLPDTCDERILEINALMTGQLLMVDDEELGLITPIPGPSGVSTMYGNPSEVTISTYGGDQEAYRLAGKRYETYIPGADNENARAVWVRDNRMGYPYINFVLEAAAKISDLERTQDVTVNRLKTPWIIKCPAQMTDTIERMFRDIDVNKQAIIAANLNEVQSIDLFSTGVNPSILGELREHRDEVERRFRELFGITSNSMTDKRERLSVPEVTANEDITDLYTDVRLEAREQFAEWCNEHFGTNITVKRRGKSDDLALDDRPIERGDEPADAEGGA